jgi:hypothetical protein
MLFDCPYVMSYVMKLSKTYTVIDGNVPLLSSYDSRVYPKDSGLTAWS